MAGGNQHLAGATQFGRFQPLAVQRRRIESIHKWPRIWAPAELGLCAGPGLQLGAPAARTPVRRPAFHLDQTVTTQL